jgi:hypothetical protein
LNDFVITDLAGKPEEKTSPGRLRITRKANNIKIVDWINLAYDKEYS